MARQDQTNEPGGCMTVFVFAVVVALLIAAVLWFVSAVGHLLELTPTYPEIDHHGHAWIDARYENVTWGYLLAVLTLVVGVPLSIALSAELGRPRPRAGRAVCLALSLIGLVAVVAFAPVGAR